MERFKYIKFGSKYYKSDKVIFGTAILLVLVLVSIILYQDNFNGSNKYYSYCPTTEKDGCFNLFYNSSYCKDSLNPVCSVEHMFPGQELGEKPSWLTTNFLSIGFLILISAFIINTLIYNKGLFKDESS